MNSSPQATAVILAAGQGKRMFSDMPKVLHRVCGRPMIHHVLDAVAHAGVAHSIVVIGPDGDRIREAVGPNGDFVVQEQQLGTAHAVRMTAPLLEGAEGDVLICCGDTPLLRGETLASLLERRRSTGAAAIVLTAEVDDPYGYGRILRDTEGNVVQIVEQRDCRTQATANIREVNTGVYCVEARHLFPAIEAVRDNNAQHEFYLPDIIPVLVDLGLKVDGVKVQDSSEMVGVNSRKQLAQATNIMRRRVIERLMDEGVTIIDPTATYIEPGVEIGRDSIVYPQTVIERPSRIGNEAEIGPGAILRRVQVGHGVTIANAVVEDSKLGSGATIGPYSHVREGSIVGEGARVGTRCVLAGAEIAAGGVVGDGETVGRGVVHPMSRVG